MGVNLGNNIASLQAQRLLTQHTDALSRVFERLSSGTRINRASDDSAGLAISSSLNSEARIYSQGARNASDGLSALSIAEGSLRELSNVVIRITELAEQSANGTYSTQQRQAIDREAQSLASEFNRILNTTKFNNKALLSQSNFDLDLQVGTTSSSNSRIRVSLNAPVNVSVGDGTLQSELSNNYTGISLDSIGVADLNGDGNNDVIGTSDSGEVSVMLGNGNGTFKAAVSYNAGYGAGHYEFVLSDLNGDGKIDYAGHNFNTGFATVMFGTGTGTFGAGTSYAISSGGTNTTGLRAGDFNGDGRIDLAAVDTGTDKLNIMINAGSGTFAAPVSYSLPGGSADELVIGYINSDNILDIGIETNTGSVQVMIGTGTGTFTAGGTFALATAGRAVILEDVNGDGYGDLIGNDGATSVGILLSNGDGTFKAEKSYTTPNQAFGITSVAVGDFNSDGKGDIVIAGLGGSNIGVLLSNGDGTFKAPTNYTASAGGQTIAVGDFNNDLVSDVAYGGNGSGHLGIYLTNATTTGGLPSFSLLTATESRSALSFLRLTLDSLNRSLGGIGAAQSRLNSAINSALVARENLQSAASRIADADIAVETSEMVRLTILQQTSAAILAQANLLPKLALDLLGR